MVNGAAPELNKIIYKFNLKYMVKSIEEMRNLQQQTGNEIVYKKVAPGIEVDATVYTDTTKPNLKVIDGEGKKDESKGFFDDIDVEEKKPNLHIITENDEDEDGLLPDEKEFLARREAEAQNLKRERLINKTLREAKPIQVKEPDHDKIVATARFIKGLPTEEKPIDVIRQQIANNDFATHDKKMERLYKLESKLGRQEKMHYDNLVQLVRSGDTGTFQKYFSDLSNKEQRGLIEVLKTKEETASYSQELEEEIIDESLVTKSIWQRVKGVFGR
jgi:hypothetical protein